MNQDVIWDYFQNEGVEAFDQNRPRLEFLVNQLAPGQRVLDIGVGSGGLIEMGLAKKVEMWGLDPGERAIARVRDNLGLGDRAVTGYSQNMPFETGSFDVVVMTEVIEHLADEIIEPTLKEVRRILRPGGRFIGTVPARENLGESMVVCPSCEHHFHRWGHLRSFDIAALQRLLSSQFDRVSVEERFFIDWDKVGWGRRMAELLKRFLSWRGIGTYGAARNLFFSASS